MRVSLRIASTVLLAIGLTTCSEAPSGNQRGPLQLAFAPRFSSQAQAIYQSLSSFAVTLDNVHVVVRTTPTGDQLGSVLKDTTVAFPATASEVTIDIGLTIQSSEQPVVAVIELREATTSYFQGIRSFVAKKGETAGSVEPVDMSYVGPGAGATFMNLFPQPATLAPSTSFPFTVRAFDRLEHAVDDLPVTWSSSDATIATVSQTGVVTSTGKSGTFTLKAKGLNGVSAQETVNVQPVATLAILQGDNQSGLVGTALSLKLQVQATSANGSPVIGATIDFSAADGRGSVSPASATTDVNGVATTTMTLGQGVGTYAFSATVPGTTSTTTRVSATAASAAAALLSILNGNNQTDSVQATLGQPLSVKVTDSFGNPVAQQAVDFEVTSQNALLLPIGGVGAGTPVRVITGTDGIATATLVGGALAGIVSVRASLPQSTIAPVSFTATLNPGKAVQLVVIQQPSVTAQATLPLGTQPRVRVTDRIGNAVAVSGLPIIVGAVTTTQLVSDTFPKGLGGTTQVTTDANGVAAYSDLSLNLQVATWQLVFSDGRESLQSAFSNPIDLAPGPAESLIAASPQQTPIQAAGDAVFPSVRVIDKVGNGVPKVAVVWAAVEPLSKLDSTSTHTDVNGYANPGTWQTPLGSLLTVFSITATTSESTLKNSPLTFSALVQPVARVVPPRRSLPAP